MNGTADSNAVRRPAQPLTAIQSIESGDHRERVLARRDDLVAGHLLLVRQIAEGVHRRLPSCFLLDDLVATGNLALTHAATRYRPAEHNGAPFSAYARPVVRGAILESVRRKNWREEDHQSLDAAPELSQNCYIPDAVAIVDSNRARRRLANAAALLPEDQRRLLAAYYSPAEPTLRDAGRQMGISARRAGQLHREAVDGLRRLLREPA
jgi:RNA polymerase sigma factor (sigma-70 family)